MIIFEKQILNFIKTHNLIKKRDSVLLSVSGGSDSVALTLALNSLKNELDINLSIFHLDHKIRKESSKDVVFVEKLAKKLNIAFYPHSFDITAYANTKKLSLQEAGRKIRYRFLEELSVKIGANLIATGHQADDQIETFFIRLLRGASLSGLRSIPVKRGKIIRPLLSLKKEDVIKYLKKRKEPFLTDPSNIKPIYLRNKVRKEVMPILKKINPAYISVLSKNINLINDEEKYLAKIVEEKATDLIKKDNNFFFIKIADFEKLPLTIKRRLLREIILKLKGNLKQIEYKHIEIILNNCNKFGFKLELPANLIAYRSYRVLLFGYEESFKPVKIEKLQFDIGCNLLIKPLNLHLKSEIVKACNSSKFVACLDYDKIKTPLTVRSRKPGDVFVPLGLKGSKKLQDFFVDLKVPKYLRDSIVIISDKEKIIWVAGYRIDERVKTDKKTTKVLRLEIW